MELAQVNSLLSFEFLAVWLAFGAVAWVLLVVFAGKIIGYDELRKPHMKSAGVLTFSVMVLMGFLCLPIIITMAIPFFESFGVSGQKRQNNDTNVKEH